jgi:predicted site-specific integrase-resolvase
LRVCQDETVTALLVTHLRRLARFGTAPLADVVPPSWGVALEVVGDDELGGGDGDLVRDMLAVVTSFAGRLYGARSARARALVEAVKGNVPP